MVQIVTRRAVARVSRFRNEKRRSQVRVSSTQGEKDPLTVVLGFPLPILQELGFPKLIAVLGFLRELGSVKCARWSVR